MGEVGQGLAEMVGVDGRIGSKVVLTEKGVVCVGDGAT